MIDDLKTHTVYPVRFMVVVGELHDGFRMYGGFESFEKAQTWAQENMKREDWHVTAYHKVEKRHA